MALRQAQGTNNRLFESGTGTWSEKPISIAQASGCALVEQAETAGLPLGIAPETALDALTAIDDAVVT